MAFWAHDKAKKALTRVTEEVAKAKQAVTDANATLTELEAQVVTKTEEEKKTGEDLTKANQKAEEAKNKVKTVVINDGASDSSNRTVQLTPTAIPTGSNPNGPLAGDLLSDGGSVLPQEDWRDIGASGCGFAAGCAPSLPLGRCFRYQNG